VPYIIKGLDDQTVACLSQYSQELLLAYADDPLARAELKSRGWAPKQKKRFDAESLDSLIQLLNRSDEDDAADAAAEIGRRHDRQAVKPLLEFIARPNNPARAAALDALGAIGDPSAIAPLIKFMTSDSPRDRPYRNWDYRVNAIRALGELKAKDAVEQLVTVANDADSYGTTTAIAALGKIGDERCAAALDRIFRTGVQGWDRRAAWRALQELHGKAIVDDDI
jgi:HEAT repeat protein